jgi:hypothetical protein
MGHPLGLYLFFLAPYLCQRLVLGLAVQFHLLLAFQSLSKKTQNLIKPLYTLWAYAHNSSRENLEKIKKFSISMTSGGLKESAKNGENPCKHQYSR